MMRFSSLALCLLSLLFLALAPYAAPSRSSSTATTTSATLIDVLSADTDYTLLLRLIQRAKLVPTLNTLNGSTLLAPTNDAIERHRNSTSSSVWSTALDSGDDELTDNVQQALRQHLFYHILNYTLDIIPEGVAVQETLHYPALTTEPPTKQPPPNEPWLPIPGGLLAGEPQRLRTLSRSGEEKLALFGVDHHQKHGAKQAKDVVLAANGVVYGIDRVLALPPSLLSTVRAHPSLKTMARLLSSDMENLLENTPHLTLFFPVDEAWDALDGIERRYLESGFAQKDMEKIVGLHASADGPGSEVMIVSRRSQVGWSDTWKTNGTTEFPTLRNHNLHLSTITSPPTIGHNATTVLDTDIYASNGVLHTVSSLLLSPTIFKLNAEKYLLALNATQFVGLLRLANLSSYVDDKAESWTILAPQDGVMSLEQILAKALAEDKNDTDHSELQRILKYHFIPGKLTRQKLEDKQLLGTELREVGLGGGRQVIEVSVRGKDGKAVAKGNGEIGFGGALVLGEPVEIGESIIYVLSSPLSPPTDVMASLLSSLEYTTFLTSVFSTAVSDVLATHPLTTVLVPRNDAWKSLGLVADHLLLAKDSLKRVVLHHVLEGVLYPGDEILGLDATSPPGSGGSSGSRTFPTLEGSDVRIDAGKVTGSGGWLSASSSSAITIHPREGTTFTQTGTTYEVTGSLLVPRTVGVSVEDLAVAGKGSIMIGLVRKAGLGAALNGTMRLDWDDHEWDDGWVDIGRKKKDKKKQVGRNGEKVGWTLLCPTDEAFKGMNLTALLDDHYALGRFVRQHLIPVATGGIAAAATAAIASEKSSGPFWFFEWMFGSSLVETNSASDVDVGMPLPVMDDATFSTLLSPSAIHGDVVFRAVEGGAGDKKFLVGIKGASGGSGEAEFANVIKWGRTIAASTGTTSSLDDSASMSSSLDQSIFSLHVDEALDSSPSLRSGVVLINRPLAPYVEGWWVTWGKATLFGFIGSIAILAGFTFLVNWFKGRESEATYEPIGPGAGGEDE